jgi:hypothetical protein
MRHEHICRTNHKKKPNTPRRRIPMLTCSMCERVTDDRMRFLDSIREDALQCIQRPIGSRGTTDLMDNGRTMRERVVHWYAVNLNQISRAARNITSKRGAPNGRTKAINTLSMQLPLAIWRRVAEYAATSNVFLLYSASVKYIPRGVLSAMLQDMCPESTGTCPAAPWPVQRCTLDRKSHSTLRCPWISSGFVCPYLSFADITYGRDVFHLTQARLVDVRLLRLMCRKMAPLITESSAMHITRGLEGVHSRILATQRKRRADAFSVYRKAIAVRSSFFAPHELLGEPIRAKFGNMWGVPSYVANADTPTMFVVTASLSSMCWECAVVSDEEFVCALHHANTTSVDYQRLADTTQGRILRRKVATACVDMMQQHHRRCVHMKAMPYGDGYRVRIFFVRNLGAHGGLRPSSSLVTVRFLCLPTTFHTYPSYKQTGLPWKHTYESLPLPFVPLDLPP